MKASSVASFFRGEITDPIFLYQNVYIWGVRGIVLRDLKKNLTSEFSNFKPLLLVFVEITEVSYILG